MLGVSLDASGSGLRMMPATSPSAPLYEEKRARSWMTRSAERKVVVGSPLAGSFAKFWQVSSEKDECVDYHIGSGAMVAHSYSFIGQT